MVEYPRPVTDLHQIELTTFCNLRCQYCVSPNLPRTKEHMSMATLERTLQWVRHFVQRGTQGELNLAGIGESTMHPQFVQCVAMARAALGPHIRLLIATNGLLITEELAEAVKPYNLRIWVSLHRPEKAGPAIEILKRHKLLNGVSADPSVAAIDWAGQVKWFKSCAPQPCDWLARGWTMVMTDGRMTTCCFDARGSGVVGHVNDEIGSAAIKPYDLCPTCHMSVP